MTQLADTIAARGRALADRALAAMYRDPFWDDRFGDRGRRFAEEDNLHHVSYLVQALRAGSPALLTGYARWLQQVLTTRGMCSRQLADNFERLAVAIQDEGIADAGPALTLLDAARAALTYDDGAPRAIQLAAGPAAARAADAMLVRQPIWHRLPGGDGRARCVDDVLTLLSYVGDSLANGRPELFADHVRWAAGFYARQGRPNGYLREALASLDEALQASLGEDDREAVSAVVGAGRAALADDATPR
jgi:hypothetical protein